MRRVLLVAWTGLSLAWLSRDRLVRDGDEEGHVGAAELFLADLSQGQPWAYIERLWVGEMGEYPQAFAALVGGWWWGMGAGLPGRTAVRAICLISLLLAALATARIATRFVSQEHAQSASLVALASVLTLPLANGLTRHFMPEGLLMAALALSILAAQRWTERPTLSRATCLGLAVGAGLMTKQTYVLLAAAPLVFLTLGMLRSHWTSLGVAGLVTAGVAAPWWLSGAAAQFEYATASSAGHGSGGLLDHVIYYPTILAKVGLGPPLCLLALWAASSLMRRATPQTRRGLLLVGAWLVGGLIVLTLIPKKYPRLLAPLTPSVGIVMAMLWVRSQRERRIIGGGLLLSAVWLVAASTDNTPKLTRNTAIDPGCPQQWVRGPSDNDLGLSTVAAMLADSPEGGVSISQDIAIPCDVQTTHDWAQHLGPYLRRSGNDREVQISAEPTQRFIIQVSGAENGISVEGTGKYLHIRDRLGP